MLIAIEGCIGAGKSTVAQGLAAYRGSQLLLEDFEANSFLRAFYCEPRRHVLETEFSFLLLHYHQLKSIAGGGAEVLSDFHLGKDLLYADLNFESSREASIFKQLFYFCDESTPKPALLVYLSAPTSLILERVRDRKREFEQEIDFSYFYALGSSYDEFYKTYSGRKISIPMDEWNFVNDPELYARLSDMIDEELSR